MKLTVVQPCFFQEKEPDKTIREFLKSKMDNLEKDEILLLPEYSNAGGLTDKSLELETVKTADEMLSYARSAAKSKKGYIGINLLRYNENNQLKNSTYLIGKDGEIHFIYDKWHIPPVEKELGVIRGDGECACQLDNITFAFMTCYDMYYTDQIGHIAKHKPDVILVSGYQRGERVDIIRAQTKLLSFRTNAYTLRSSYSMNSDSKGGCTMIVKPDGEILTDMGKNVGHVSVNEDIKWKYMRSAGYGGGMVRNDDFINYGLIDGGK